MLALLFGVGLPAAFTAIAPVSIVALNRTGLNVSARVTNHLLFVIPYREQSLASVDRAADEFHRGETYVEMVERNGRQVRESRRNEDEAYLLLTGNDESIKVPVSPANIKEVLGQVEQFLASPEPSELRMRVVANWKVSVIAGGALTLLTVVYVLAMAWRAVRYPVRLLLTTPGEETAGFS
jgi:hypothetical protein